MSFCTDFRTFKSAGIPSLTANTGRQEGFTLVEMLIALMLSSVIFVSAYQVMSNLIQYQVRAAKKQVVLQDQLILRNLFQQIIGKSLPQSSLYYRIQKNSLFTGQEEKLQLISRAYSDHFDDPGYRVYSLFRKDKYLMLSYRRYDKENIQEIPETLSTGLRVEELAFEYQSDDDWLNEWTDNESYPQKIKVKLLLADQQNVEWIVSTGQL